MEQWDAASLLPSASDDAGLVQRAVERYAMRFALATTVIAGFVSCTLAPRAQLLQVRRIKKTMRQSVNKVQAKRIGHDPVLRLPVMTPLANALQARFNEPPHAPLIVTGPDGVGKATLLLHALQKHQEKGAMCLYLSLSHSPVRSADSFVRLFVERCGFLVSPTNNIIMRSLLRTRPDKARISEEDIEKAFAAIQLALAQESNSSWRRGLPVICIEEMHIQGRHMINTQDPLIGRFLEWCSHLSLNQLAHVVFVTSVRAAMMLEKEPGLFRVRDLMFVDFPNEKRVKQVLEKLGNQLSEEDKSMVFDKLGGDMQDMHKVIYAVQRGTPVHLAVEDRIVEALQGVEREITRLIRAILDAAGDRKAQLEAAARFCRFWRLMETFSQKSKVPRSELISTIFGVQHSSELRSYVKHGLLTFTLRPVNKRLVGDRRLKALFPRTTWPEEWIATGSPVLREAFERILQLPHYAHAQSWAAALARSLDLDELQAELTHEGDRLKGRAAEAVKTAEVLGKISQLDWTTEDPGQEDSVKRAFNIHYNRALRLIEHSEIMEEQISECQHQRREVRSAIAEAIPEPTQ